MTPYLTGKVEVTGEKMFCKDLSQHLQRKVGGGNPDRNPKPSINTFFGRRVPEGIPIFRFRPVLGCRFF